MTSTNAADIHVESCTGALENYLENNFGYITVLSIDISHQDNLEKYVIEWGAPGAEGYDEVHFDKDQSCKVVFSDHYEW